MSTKAIHFLVENIEMLCFPKAQLLDLSPQAGLLVS